MVKLNFARVGQAAKFILRFIKILVQPSAVKLVGWESLDSNYLEPNLAQVSPSQINLKKMLGSES